MPWPGQDRGAAGGQEVFTPRTVSGVREAVHLTYPRMSGLAKELCAEIAGLVNDRGTMDRVLDGRELAERQQFASEGGREASIRKGP